ncbi:hypothetical protein DDZ18_07615 [Marinicauda salina]|uniref:NAD(P)-binding domain-containing protein n=1 Tax=Marinicauda salina TaxID=2135793 RepID=A0A2U2BU64_9PROT|nr:SDR family oxidoreductase [Marinicauda salina]PWE17530.1 hypothetical protein DDZ18_07615 [Marinicauda salina]
MRVLVLGGYGLIGSAIARACLDRGWRVTGAGRRPVIGQQRIPGAEWARVDLAAPNDPAWRSLLDGVDVVINAAGALQDGGRDDLEAVHARGLAAFVDACDAAGVKRFVQISAPGAAADAATAFLRTKAAGDAAVRARDGAWAILKPGLVIGPAAYGGSGLIRGLAALPFVQPIAHADSPARTVALSDVADEAAACAAGERTDDYEADLVEPDPRTLGGVIAALRAWLGLPRARIVRMPGWTAGLAGAAGDLAAALGWATPLRSTAMRTMANGVDGDPAAARASRGADLMTLEATLARMPASAQERLYARLYCVRPLVIVVLAVFWVASGAIGLARFDAAAGILETAGAAAPLPALAVAGGSLADLGLGVAVLHRATSRAAMLGMIGVSVAYLAAATILTPGLWADPLGPLIKIFPAAALALAGLAMDAGER